MGIIERAHIFVTSHDKILVLQQSDGAQWWECPGGTLESGEDAATAAVRETFEETGLRIDAPQLLRAWSHRNRRDDLVQCYQFVAEAPAGDVVLSSEHRAYEWMTVDEYDRRYCGGLAAGLPDGWLRTFLTEMSVNCASFNQPRAAKGAG